MVHQFREKKPVLFFRLAGATFHWVASDYNFDIMNI